MILADHYSRGGDVIGKIAIDSIKGGFIKTITGEAIGTLYTLGGRAYLVDHVALKAAMIADGAAFSVLPHYTRNGVALGEINIFTSGGVPQDFLGYHRVLGDDMCRLLFSSYTIPIVYVDKTEINVFIAALTGSGLE